MTSHSNRGNNTSHLVANSKGWRLGRGTTPLQSSDRYIREGERRVDKVREKERKEMEGKGREEERRDDGRQ